MATESETFGSSLRRFRTAAELTQEELAERAGLSVRSISDIERGLNRSPYQATVERLIEALACSDEAAATLQASVSRRRGPATPVAEQPLTNLPAAPNPLIGRESDEAAVVHLLRWEGRRLLTLTGAGGVGKTRLALRVAQTVAPDFTGGSVFVPLAAVHHYALVAPAIAAVLGLPEVGRQGPEDRLLASLAVREVLLVLDNFEQVVDAAPFVVRLLGACPKVKVLATSRIPLHVHAEQEVDVRALGMPEIKDRSGPEELRRFPAVELFLNRAQLVLPSFSLTSRNARTVAEICRALDGLPLAIELAAARIKGLTAEEILSHLGHRLDLLTGGARDLPVRHHTMRNTIAWSYNLLDNEPQRLFRHVSVFVGGFDLHAINAVCARDGRRTMELLLDLVDQSVVQVQERLEEITRYTVLETVREYGLEQLARHTEGAETREYHAGYFLALAEEAAPALTGPDQAMWTTRLEKDYANLQTALTWGQEHSTEAGLRLATALWRFWYIRGQLSEGRRWLRRLLAADDFLDVPERLQATTFFAAGALAYAQTDHREAHSLFDRSLALRRSSGTPIELAETLNGLGLVAINAGEYAHGRQLLEESALLRREADEPFALGATLNNLANVLRYQGEYKQAVALYEESLQLYRAAGDQAATANTLNNLGQLATEQGDFQHAVEFSSQALQIAQEQGTAFVVAQSLDNLGQIALDEGEFQRATSLFGEAGVLYETIGDTAGTALTLYGLATVALRQGVCPGAQHQAAQSLSLFQANQNRRCEGLALALLGDLAVARGDHRQAEIYYTDALTIHREVGYLLGLAETLERIARLDTKQGDWEAAARKYSAATTLRERMGTRPSPNHQTADDEAVKDLRKVLGDNAFALAWTAGECEVTAYLRRAQGLVLHSSMDACIRTGCSIPPT